MSSQLDFEQVLPLVLDEPSQSLQVTVVGGGGGGGATAANQTNGDQKTQVVDGSGNVIGSTANALDVNIKSGVTLEVHLDNANDNVLVYGYDGAVNQPIKTDAAGELQVDVLSSALPSGAATSANQVTELASLASIDGKIVTVDTDDVTVTSSVLPTGASTAANQATEIASLASIDGKIVTVDTSNVTVASSALPTGAATSANQTNKAQYTRLTDGTDDALVTAAGELNVLATAQPGIDIGDVTVNNAAGGAAVNIQDGGNSITVDGSVAVNNAAGASAVNIQDGGNSITVDGTVAATQSGTWNVNSSDTGYANSEFVRNDYSSVNVTTAAYVTLIASTAQAYKQFEIFDSSGQTLVIAFGAAASEVDQFLVFPGGNGAIRKSVPSGTRISIKAVSATASVGEIDLNLYG